MTQKEIYEKYEVKRISFDREYDEKITEEIIKVVSNKVAVSVGASCIGHDRAYQILDRCAEDIKDKAPHIQLYDNVFRSYIFYI
jgi:hypothetical protein